jgi:autotransporter-associated beta strand protein
MKSPHPLAALGALVVALGGTASAQTLYRSGGGTWNGVDSAWGTSSGGPYAITAWNSGAPSSAVLEGVGGSLTLGTGITANAVTFEAAGFTLAGGALGFAGTTPRIVSNQPGLITSAVTSAALRKEGTAALNLAGGMTLTDGLTLAAGRTTFAGSGTYAAGLASPLTVGSGTGSRAVLALEGSGTVSLGEGVVNANVRVGSGSGVAGAVAHSSGNVRIGSSNLYGYLLVGATAGYGYYRMDGGSLDVGSGAGRLGLIIGDGSTAVGVWEQTGGVATFNRYIVMANTSLNARGEATFTGGTLNQTLSGNYFLVGDDGPGRLNLGTLAGGTALIATAANLKLGEAGVTASGHLNLNAGTLRFTASTGGIRADTDGRDTPGRELALALNGGMIQAAANNIKLIWGGTDAPLTTRLYNGGVTCDTQGFNATVETPILATTGNGIVIANPFTAAPTGAAGAGYIGPPQVAVSGGSGTGAQVQAVVDSAAGTISGFVIVNPGQGYLAGDRLTFTLSGNAGSTLAAPYQYTLQAADLAANGTGIFRKQGAGTLTLTAANTFAGETRVAAGTLKLAATGSLLSSRITIEGGAVFDAFDVVGFRLASGQSLAGTGTFTGSVLFDSGAGLVFNAANPLTVASGTVTFGSGFGIDDIIGLDGTTIAAGTYTLIDGAVDLTGLANVGFANRLAIGGGQEAYFQGGSLQLVVVPEPGVGWLAATGLLGGLVRLWRCRRGENRRSRHVALSS